ncbi:glutamine amidotransferase / cyclase [Desulfacinum infernum DSM 9756]|uniref:Imidazole glycerol phosphate synthase subunit HisH n=1 Tax=Desulfacinum infernum DSM 9756 TaxID=1121391 RepID=A0A1M4ZEL4_9BACT|nr:imidazole glycerol phosphate synthase subunit HisF [Desulfacinum infernum]SHF16247.1 glutamine amidotransferase / cyclase [Desulfacinum infernum DSM 9756]
MVTVLDYGAGNVRSVVNAIGSLGREVRFVERPEDILQAERLVFPGVGAFGEMMRVLRHRGYVEPLLAYLRSDRPFLGICLGLQALFEGSEEAPGEDGLGFFPGIVRRFRVDLAVPHIGWNGIKARKPSVLFRGVEGNEKVYFVHSYHVEPRDPSVVLTATDYGVEFVSAVEKGRVAAVQFHPEKSGPVGLKILKNFLEGTGAPVLPRVVEPKTQLAKRIIACLDVRANDRGDLVVTKGDQYDVREKGQVRNLGKPVDLARRYYEEGADEITFLNITGFRDFPLKDMPMLEVLRRTSEKVFVPLTIGGGIRDYTDKDGTRYGALQVASEYFRSGADKVSIGSDAVTVVEEVLKTGAPTGRSAIEEISRVYGSQAVVISIDPRRVYVPSPDAVPHRVMETAFPGPGGERYCWYQCTVKGGREGRPVDAVTLARVCEDLGAGEILLNCIDRDGTNLGFDLELIHAVREAVTIPVIASSGAGCPEHFLEVFTRTRAEAALAAGIFHRREVGIGEVKELLRGKVPVRLPLG